MNFVDKKNSFMLSKDITWPGYVPHTLQFSNLLKISRFLTRALWFDFYPEPLAGGLEQASSVSVWGNILNPDTVVVAGREGATVEDTCGLVAAPVVGVEGGAH